MGEQANKVSESAARHIAPSNPTLTAPRPPVLAMAAPALLSPKRSLTPTTTAAAATTTTTPTPTRVAGSLHVPLAPVPQTSNRIVSNPTLTVMPLGGTNTTTTTLSQWVPSDPTLVAATLQAREELEKINVAKSMLYEAYLNALRG